MNHPAIGQSILFYPPVHGARFFAILGTRYHFTTGEVDSGFVSEIKQLNSLNEEKLFGLIGMIIDFLADPKVGTQSKMHALSNVIFNNLRSLYVRDCFKSSDFLGATKSFCAKYKIKVSRMKVQYTPFCEIFDYMSYIA